MKRMAWGRVTWPGGGYVEQVSALRSASTWAWRRSLLGPGCLRSSGTSQGGKPSSSKLPCRSAVGSRPWVATLDQSDQHSQTSHLLKIDLEFLVPEWRKNLCSFHRDFVVKKEWLKDASIHLKKGFVRSGIWTHAFLRRPEYFRSSLGRWQACDAWVWRLGPLGHPDDNNVRSFSIDDGIVSEQERNGWLWYRKKRAKMRNASRFCVSSLRRGHANLLCIVPILVYVSAVEYVDHGEMQGIYSVQSFALLSPSLLSRTNNPKPSRMFHRFTERLCGTLISTDSKSIYLITTKEWSTISRQNTGRYQKALLLTVPSTQKL